MFAIRHAIDLGPLVGLVVIGLGALAASLVPWKEIYAEEKES